MRPDIHDLYILHGIKVRDPMQSIGKLVRFMSVTRDRLWPIVFDYGYVPALLAPLANRIILRRLLKKMRPNQIGLGHSNGCLLLYKCSNALPFRGIVLLNPALDSSVTFDSRLDFIHIYYSRQDDITLLSSLIPNSSWGAMGTYGYTGPPDPRVSQWELPISHTFIHSDAGLSLYAPTILSRITAALSQPKN